ncbi:MAG: TIGR01906 family membrane protein [Clostridia bacterium]|nr:TIGR01906 family membrane protein [Clostridia bacterium]
MSEKIKNRLLSILGGVALAVAILCFSIALPIYVRPFYYAQINALGLPERTGYSREQIKDAYDGVLDYLTLPGKEFSTGVFPHSAEGAAHFADCRALFTLNLLLLLGACLTLILLKMLQRGGVFVPSRPFGRPLPLTVGGALLLLFAALGIFVGVNFKAAFTLFHKLFFAGESNWKFDPESDAIITALPNAFFLNCGALIAGSAILFSLSCIAYALYKAKKAP